MNWLLDNLRWLLPSAAGLIALVAWQRYTTHHRAWTGPGAGTVSMHQTAGDPVTGNKVETAHALTAIVGGQTYHFESEASRTVFQQDPERYVHRHHRHHGCC